MAKEAGIPVELLDALDALPTAEREFAMQNFVARLTVRASFPTNKSVDPGRRVERLGQEAPSAPEYTTVRRSRSVVLGRHEATDLSKQYLEAEYTDDTDTMRCQGCQQAMPFRKSDGKWYFEAIQFFPKRAKTHRENALAMCLLCAAHYSYARSTPDNLLLKQLRERTENRGGRESDTSNRAQRAHCRAVFHRAARGDLITVLAAAGESRLNKVGTT